MNDLGKGSGSSELKFGILGWFKFDPPDEFILLTRFEAECGIMGFTLEYGGDRLWMDCGVVGWEMELAGLAVEILILFGDWLEECEELDSFGDLPLTTLFLVPPLNIALTSSQAWVISSGGLPLSFMCLRQELKFAASGWMYLSPGPIRCEWKMNLFGEKNSPQYEHLMHLARDELYLDGRKDPRHPQAHSWWTLNAKSSGNRGGALSPRNDLQSLSASRLVIIPHRLDDTGIAPARRRISSWTGVHCTQVIPKATRRLWISL